MSLLTNPAFLALVLLISNTIVFVLALVRIERDGRVPTLRALEGIDALRTLPDRSIEEGRAVHLALGTGAVDRPTAAETLMGLTVLDPLAEHALQAGQVPIISTSDPAAQLVAADRLTVDDGRARWQNRLDARFIAPEPIAYGAGTRGMIQRERLGLTAAVGHLGDEYLFVAAGQPDGGHHFFPPEVAATARIETLPFLHLTARYPLIGEELFALGAYLRRWPAHMASLLMQDVGRVLVVLAILLLALLRTLGVL